MEALFLEEVKAITAGRRAGSSSSESLETPGVDASVAKTPTLSSPSRSRTKVKRSERSSLEFLNNDASTSANGGSSKDKRKRILVSTTQITPSGASAAAQFQNSPKQKQHNTSRRMSPQSKSKLDSLVSPSKKIMADISSEVGGRIDNNRGDKGKKNPVSDKNNSSPQISYSPLDYRLPSNIDNTKNNKSIQDDDDNQMLETYVDQWTKPSPTDGNKKEEEVNNYDDLDDPSSSVISTSSNSTNEEEGEGGEEYKSMDKVKKLSLPKQQQLIPSKAKQSDINRRDTSQHVLSPPISLKLDPQLELEYGKLAFMKKELEHKMKMHQNLGKSTADSSSIVNKTKPLFTLGDSGSTTTDVKPGEGNDSLELEYGKLAFMKQELEHKMKLHKMDAERVHPLSLTTTYHHPSSTAAANNGGIKYDESAQTQSVVTRRRDDENDTIPSRQDVAFGEMAYQRMVEKQKLMTPHHYLEGGYDNDVATKYKERQYGGRHPSSHHREGRNTDDDYSSVEYDHEYHNDRPKKSKKKKKKRKRRMVETITRVIHEESEEEEGSSSTGNHHRGHYYETKRPMLDYGRKQESFTPERKGRVSKAYESEEDEFSQREAEDHDGHGRSKQTRRKKRPSGRKEAAYYPAASRQVTKKSQSAKRQQKQNKRGRLNTSSMLETLN